MTLRSIAARIGGNETLRFILTNRIPRRTATMLVGWISRIEIPLIRWLSITVWRLFSDLDLTDARKSTFTSLHDCFVRELKDGARPFDLSPDVLSSPCDAIVGACGRIENGVMLQVKGSTYELAELVRDQGLVAEYRNGTYITLRLTASMYHRFHAPHDVVLERVAHIAGDVWNVDPATLCRIGRVYCRNERAVLQFTLPASGQRLTLVPVAAILVAGIRLHCLPHFEDRHHTEPWVRECRVAFAKGDEIGWFEHGSTIIVLAPADFVPAEAIASGQKVRCGQALMQMV